MRKFSAGILLFRRLTPTQTEVFLAHPGGPLWTHKDEGSWTIPKGEYKEGEDALQVARREFEEEIGVIVDGNFVALGSTKQPSGKIVTAWALETLTKMEWVSSNTFEMEWPPRSGRVRRFPEVEKAEWFALGRAREKIQRSQIVFLDRLSEFCNSTSRAASSSVGDASSS